MTFFEFLYGTLTKLAYGHTKHDPISKKWKKAWEPFALFTFRGSMGSKWSILHFLVICDLQKSFLDIIRSYN